MGKKTLPNIIDLDTDLVSTGTVLGIFFFLRAGIMTSFALPSAIPLHFAAIHSLARAEHMDFSSSSIFLGAIYCNAKHFEVAWF